MTLLIREISISMKSLTYWLVICFLGLFLFTQLSAGMTHGTIKPKANQTDYGTVQETNKNEIKKQTITNLLMQYSDKRYITYPFGFAKTITPNKKDQTEIEKILENATNTKIHILEQRIDDSSLSIDITLSPSYTYNQFKNDMKKVEDILGNGSDFSVSRYQKLTTRKMTYQEAVKNFDELLNKDKVSGAIARYVCDYLGIIIALLPIFLSATVVQRDKRSHSQLVIATKSVSSIKLLLSRFVSTIILLIIPVLIICAMPALQSLFIAQRYNQNGSLLLFYQYIIGWTLPTIIAVVGLNFLLSISINSIVSILLQVILWFSMLILGGTEIVGKVGISLIPRFNTVGSTALFQKILPELIFNRLGWTIFGLICFGASCWVFNLKRGGYFNGK